MDKLLLKIPQVCDLTQLGRSTIYQLLDQPGGLATVRIGRAVRVHIDEVRRWVRSQQAARHEKINKEK
jgi:excisionase family DNA binding protein